MNKSINFIFLYIISPFHFISNFDGLFSFKDISRKLLDDRFDGPVPSERSKSDVYAALENDFSSPIE